MTTVLLDTHALHWWVSEPAKLSAAAEAAVTAADELGVSGVTWYELAWLARHGRIRVAVPIRSWLDRMAGQVLTFGLTPAVADTAAALPASFPGDPVDRVIYATAVEHGIQLVTKDRRLRSHRHSRSVTIW